MLKWELGDENMSRPKGIKNTFHTKEEKLALTKRMIAGESGRALEKETGVNHSLIHKWTKQYLELGEDALENKRKPGNPLAKYTRKKELTYQEQLEYENELLKRELMIKEAEVEKLKKSIKLKGGDIEKLLYNRYMHK